MVPATPGHCQRSVQTQSVETAGRLPDLQLGMHEGPLTDGTARRPPTGACSCSAAESRRGAGASVQPWRPGTRPSTPGKAGGHACGTGTLPPAAEPKRLLGESGPRLPGGLDGTMAGPKPGLGNAAVKGNAYGASGGGLCDENAGPGLGPGNDVPYREACGGAGGLSGCVDGGCAACCGEPGSGAALPGPLRAASAAVGKGAANLGLGDGEEEVRLGGMFSLGGMSYAEYIRDKVLRCILYLVPGWALCPALNPKV